MFKESKQIGIKSEKLYDVKCLYGLPHQIQLIWREYKCGKSIYIVKTILKYKDSVKVYRDVFHDKNTALKAYREALVEYTICNIDWQIQLPF